MTTTLSQPLSTPVRTSRDVLIARPIDLDGIPRAAWDRLLARTAAATPFSRWTLHRAWWDAYGATAHAQYLVCVGGSGAGEDGAPPDADRIRAIVPLMHRHEVEPDDAATATALRRPTVCTCGVSPDAKAVFFGASYHADYATVLCDPTDLPEVAAAVIGALAAPPDASHGSQRWDVVDLRRLRHDDPAADALHEAFVRHAAREPWHVQRDQEDVCPVLTFPESDDWETYLGSLDKKARHEIRRKLRRAEASGQLEFTLLPPTHETVEAFIALHQARWGDEGLFRDTEGGARSRRFLHRLAELEAREEAGATLQFGQLTVDGRAVFATVGFDDGTTCYFYNAGMDPTARDLSPGVTGTAAYLRDRLEAGRRRFDFLRGDESYKYDWGAVDEPIFRLLITRHTEAHRR